MTTITTNTAAASRTTAIATLVARIAALKPTPKSPEALLDAEARREAARAAADRLLR